MIIIFCLILTNGQWYIFFSYGQRNWTMMMMITKTTFRVTLVGTPSSSFITLSALTWISPSWWSNWPFTLSLYLYPPSSSFSSSSMSILVVTFYQWWRPRDLYLEIRDENNFEKKREREREERKEIEERERKRGHLDSFSHFLFYSLPLFNLSLHLKLPLLTLPHLQIALQFILTASLDIYLNH